MIDPLFWLGLSILLVAVSLTAVLVAALPVLQELARAARSLEKLADTLNRELPPTLETIRLTGLEITNLTDDVSQGVKSASQVAKKVDQGINNTQNQAKNLQTNTRSVVAGIKAAWKTWNRPSSSIGRRSLERLPSSQSKSLGERVRPTVSPRGEASLEESGYQAYSAASNEAEGINFPTSYQEIPGDSLPPRQYEDSESTDIGSDY